MTAQSTYTEKLGGKWRKPISHTDCYLYAQELRDRAARMSDSASHAHDGCVGSYITGNSGRTRAMNRACDRAMDTMLNRINESKRLLERAAHWQYIGEQQDPELIKKRIQQNAKKAEATATLNDWVMAQMVPGAQFVNPGGNIGTVKKAKIKSITCTSGIKWDASEISPAIDGRPMTRDEIRESFKVWKDAQ